MSDDNFDINGIFDHLDPDDFNRETSAIDETPGDYRGEEGFARFCAEMLRATRMAFAAADGSVNPVAVLASPTVQRVFAPDDDETLRQYLDRLGREARTIGACWFFMMKKTLAGSFDPDHDPDTPEALQEALASGQMQEAVLWYADRREGNERQIRTGFQAVIGNKLGEMVEGGASATLAPFGSVLDAVRQ